MDATSTHPSVQHPHESLNNLLGDKISSLFGSMTTFWLLVCWQIGWIGLAEAGVWLFKGDKYPFAFLLFLSNLIQLWALPVLGNTANRADVKRNAKADADHVAMTYLAQRADQIADHLGIPAPDGGA